MEDKILQYENFRKRRDEEKEARQNRIKKRLEELKNRRNNQCLADLTNKNKTKPLNKKPFLTKLVTNQQNKLDNPYKNDNKIGNEFLKIKSVQKEKIAREERILQYEEYKKKKEKEKKLREDKIKKRLDEIRNTKNKETPFLDFNKQNNKNEKIHNNKNNIKHVIPTIKPKKNYINLNKVSLKNKNEYNNKNLNTNSNSINNKLTYGKATTSGKPKVERKATHHQIKPLSTLQAQCTIKQEPKINPIKSNKIHIKLLKQNNKDINKKNSQIKNVHDTHSVLKNNSIHKKKASFRRSLIRSPQRSHRHKGCFTLTQHASVFATGYTVRQKKSIKKAIKPTIPLLNLNETITLEEAQDYNKPVIEMVDCCEKIEAQHGPIACTQPFDDVDKENIPHSSNIMNSESIDCSSSVFNQTRLEREVDPNNEINSRQLLYLCKEVQSVDFNQQGSTLSTSYCVTPVKRTTRKSAASSSKKPYEMLVDNLLRMSLQREQRVVYKNNKCIPEINFDMDLFE